MASRRDKKNRLFRELAADLAKIRPLSVNKVCCPLCLRDFTIEAIKELSVELSISSKIRGASFGSDSVRQGAIG